MFLNNLKIILVTIVTFLVHAYFVVYTMHTLGSVYENIKKTLIRPINKIRFVVYDCHSTVWNRVLKPSYTTKGTVLI